MKPFVQKDFILLIPHYNNPDGLMQSLKSVCYTNGKFEVLIVDDGSENLPGEEKIRQSLPELEFTLLRLPANKGVVYALNEGLRSLSGRKDFVYIARLDCGDICDPERFYKQVKFMENNQNIALLGTWCRFRNSLTDDAYIYRTETVHENIKKEMIFRCSFIHPSVMFRKKITEAVGVYPDNYPHAEDYAFFYNILQQFRGAILPEILVSCAINPQGVSAAFRKQQLLSRLAIVKKYSNSFISRQLSVLKLYLLLLLPYSLIMWLKVKSKSKIKNHELRSC